MTFESVVLLLAAAQAFLLAALIFQKHRAVYANRFLSLMMFVVGIAVVHMLLQDNGFYDRFPQLLYAILGILFLVAPLHYLYTKYLTSSAKNFKRSDYVHFLPAVVTELIVYSLVLVVPRLLALPPGDDAALLPFPFRVYNWAVLLCGIPYTLAALLILNRYHRTIKKVASSLENVRLNWLVYLTLAGLAVWIVFLIENTLMTFGLNASNFVITSVCAGLYVYTIGYYGLLKSEVFSVPAVESAMHEISLSAADEAKSVGKYERSGLDDETSEIIKGKLLELMDKKKPYTNASLTLTQLAGMLSITSHNLSEVINTKFGKNFYDLVNGYRVELVKRDLSDPAKKDLKILYIAFDAGFNSKATFNGIFKQVTTLTPSEFRKRVLAAAELQKEVSN